MAQNEPIRRAPSSAEIPDKLYFRIGDVAKLCQVPAYVLRFWETEFPQLKPNKGGTGQRLYRRRDVEMALRIKRLLYDEGYTIPGARQVFKSEQQGKEPQLALAIESATSPANTDLRKWNRIRKELQDLHALLSRPAAAPSAAQVRSIRPMRSPRPQLSLAPTPVRDMDDLFALPTHPEPTSTE